MTSDRRALRDTGLIPGARGPLGQRAVDWEPVPRPLAPPIETVTHTDGPLPAGDSADPTRAGADPDDPATAGARVADYIKALDTKALAGARLGVPRKGFFGSNRSVDTVMTAALAKLRELGAVLVDPAELEIAPDVGPAE